MKTILAAGLASTLLLISPATVAQERDGDPLQGLTHCFDRGEFRAQGTYRLSPSVVSRQVDTAAGAMYVSVADGYRMMIYRKSTSPLVNLMIERSMPGQFGVDRDAILKQMAALAAGSAPPEQLRVEQSTVNGIEIAAIHKPAMDTAGVISIIALFDAATGTIATAQVLNQLGPAREFSSEADFATLRGHFVGALTACMAHPS